MNEPRHKPDYGLDAPGVVLDLLIWATVFLLLAPVLLAPFSPVLAASAAASCLGGSFCLAITSLLMIASSKLGKRIARRKIVAKLDLRGDEIALDIGCGRGLMLSELARSVPDGTAVGVDIWQSEDQSGNSPAATRSNVIAEGVGDTAAVITGDARRLPFVEQSYDAIVSCLALHNIPSAAERARAIQDAARVLRPGGRIVIMDMLFVRQYASFLRQAGLRGVHVSGLVPSLFPPCRIVAATKPLGTLPASASIDDAEKGELAEI